ncbi:hypothetical protein PSTT_07695, partial [Puccinia striiformis]
RLDGAAATHGGAPWPAAEPNRSGLQLCHRPSALPQARIFQLISRLRTVVATFEMSLMTSIIGLRYATSRSMIIPTRYLTLPPLAIPSPARASKSPVSRFSSSTSAHSDSSEKGPDDLIASLRSDLKNAMKTKNLVQRDVIKVLNSAIKKRVEAAKIALESSPPRIELNEQILQEVELLKKYLTFFSSNHPNQNSNEEALMKTVHDCISKLGLSPDATLQERQNSLGKLIKSVKIMLIVLSMERISQILLEKL